MFVKNPGLPKPKPEQRPKVPMDPFAYDVVTVQPAQEVAEEPRPVGGWIGGTMGGEE